MSTSEYSRPRKLVQTDDVSGFDSSQVELNEWIARYALISQTSGMATVFVSTQAGRVAGYYALATGGVSPETVPARVARGIPRFPVPVILLARLAVDRRDEGAGLGRALVGDALRRVAIAAEHVGVRALLVHAKDESARAFYLNIAEFEPSPTDPLHLYLLMKDLRKAITAQP